MNGGLFALLSIFFQQVPNRLFNQLVEPLFLIHTQMGQFPHERLIES